MSSTTSVAAISEDRMARRACAATIVSVTAPLIAAAVIIPTVVVVTLAANLATQVVTVMSNIAALRARDGAVRTVDASLLPNLASALA
jgi:hypothetical protein